MNALETNPWTDGWNRIGREMQKPKGIVSISAHWYLPGALVTAVDRPRTIHDFGGFPRALYEYQYPAPGDLALAERVASLTGADLDAEWGLDHGTWAVLCHVFPKADVPVVQLSIDETQPAEYHYDVGRRLAPLRDEGYLVIGSGNLVHNLHTYAWGRHPAAPFDWAIRFETMAREAMSSGRDEVLVGYEHLGKDAQLAAPTPDHYLPLLYVLGARHAEDQVSFPVEGIDGGSVSMLSVVLA